MSTATVDTGEIASHIARLTALAGECGEVAAMIGAAEVPWNPVISPMVPAQAEATGCAVNAAALALALSRTYTETAGILVIALPRYEELERGVAALFAETSFVSDPFAPTEALIGLVSPAGEAALLTLLGLLQTPEGALCVRSVILLVTAATEIGSLPPWAQPLKDFLETPFFVCAAPGPAGVLSRFAMMLLLLGGNRKIRLVGSHTVSAAQRSQSLGGTAGSMAYFAHSVPAGTKKGQVRIDRFVAPNGSVKYTVSIDGTRDWGMMGKEPFNLAANFQSYNGDRSESEKAVREAMKQAGITSKDEVQIVGHSQGGIVAADLARSGDYNIKNVTTFGSPVDQLKLPPGVNVLAVQHDNDLIPALGGMGGGAGAAGAAASSNAPVLAYQTSSGPVTKPTSADFLPAHNIDAYRKTAAAMDAGAASPASQKAMQERADFYRGCQLDSSTTYEFESETVGDD